VKDHRGQVRGWAIAGLATFCLMALVSPAPAAGLDSPAQNSPITSGVPGRGASDPLVRVKSEGTLIPGARVKLRLDGPSLPGCRYLWIQTAGPPLDLKDRTGQELGLTIPTGADALSFLLVIADDRSLRVVPVTVLIAGTLSAATEGPKRALVDESEPKADAGDDLIGLVGRRITLNGSASAPHTNLSHRWFQVDGPEVELPLDAGRYFSFVPKVAGRYRFGLVVGHANRISAPAFVTVSVGMMPAPAFSPGLGVPGVAPPLFSSLPAATDLESIVGTALASLDDAPSLAGPLADSFSDTAHRIDLYNSYAELYGELSRRLDSVVPQDALRRGRWNSVFFEPLTRHIINGMLPLGLDLRTSVGQVAPLSDVQKQELRSQFQRLSKRLNSARTGR